MTDHWTPLAEHNPVPGDPWAMLALADRLCGRGVIIRDVLDDLRKVDSTGYWQSSAAAGFMEVRDGVLPKLELLATRFEKTSTALRTYSERLEEAQTKAEGARLKAQAAQTTIHQAERDLARKAMEAPTFPLDAPVVAVFTTPDPDQRALESGQGELTLARQLLADAEHLRDRAAGNCAAIIDAALHDDLRNDDGGLWGGVTRFAKDLVDDFPYVDDIARFAGLASGALGLLSLIPPLTPFLAPAAAIAGGISLLANSTLAAAGEQGWGPAMWDAVGLAAFGVGRLATVACRARAGEELATKAKYFADVRLAAQGNVAPRSILTPLGTTKVATTARHFKQTTGVFGRAARPYLGPGGQPVGNWKVLRSAAAFWNHGELPSQAILDVAPRAARLAGASHLLSRGEIALDVRDIATDLGVHSGVQRIFGEDRRHIPSVGSDRPETRS